MLSQFFRFGFAVSLSALALAAMYNLAPAPVSAHPCPGDEKGVRHECPEESMQIDAPIVRHDCPDDDNGVVRHPCPGDDNGGNGDGDGDSKSK